MKLHLDIPDAISKLLLDEGERLGMSLSDYAQMILRQEGQRLWHVERSKPKPKEERLRPRSARVIDVRARRVGMIGARLLAIYHRLKEQLGDEYPIVFSDQEADIRKAIEAGDLETLQHFDQNQPWTKRWEINGNEKEPH